MDLEAAVFPLLLMTCCNGDECSAYSNAIFWHSSCEKGHLLNTSRRKLLFWENRNSDSTINLEYSPSPLHLLLGSNCSRAWSEAVGTHTVRCCRSKHAQVPPKGAPSAALRASIYRLETGWVQSPSMEESGSKGKQSPRANFAYPWENQQTFHTSNLFNFCIPRQRIYIKQQQRLKAPAVCIEEINTGWQSMTSSPFSLAPEQSLFGLWSCNRTGLGYRFPI